MNVTGFWMRNNADSDGVVEFLVFADGKWIRVFPMGAGPEARDRDQMIDHMIHPHGVEMLATDETLVVSGPRLGGTDE